MANSIGQGNFSGGVAVLTTIQEKIDGESPPADWMEASPEKTALAEAIAGDRGDLRTAAMEAVGRICDGSTVTGLAGLLSHEIDQLRL